jgi:2-oxoglutarate dehydrogenase E1 component
LRRGLLLCVGLPRIRAMDSLNLPYVEALFEDFLNDPDSVPERWREYFRSVNGHDTGVKLQPSFAPRSIFNPPARADAGPRGAAHEAALLQEKIDRLIRVYRVRGSSASQINNEHQWPV